MGFHVIPFWGSCLYPGVQWNTLRYQEILWDTILGTSGYPGTPWNTLLGHLGVPWDGRPWNTILGTSRHLSVPWDTLLGHLEVPWDTLLEHLGVP